MNRRTFLKALIGIPALLIAGKMPKMPKVGREAVKDIDYTGWKFYGGYDVVGSEYGGRTRQDVIAEAHRKGEFIIKIHYP